MGGSNKSLAYYRQDTKSTLKVLGVTKDGLSAAEAAKRLEQYGSNRIQQSHKESVVHKYFKQYKDLMIAMLLASAVLSVFLGDRHTAIALVFLVAFNTLIGFSQEYKAEKMMDSLEKLVVQVARVLRDGKLIETDASKLVPGEIVYVEEGDSVPADLRVISESEFATNDFALTGESNPSRKFTHAIESEVPIGDRHNLTFMGTTVASGHAYGIVIGTGTRTELGRIASLSADTVADTSPLQRELNTIAAQVTKGTILLCAALLPVAQIFGNLPLKTAFLFAIGIASSIIPQGLPAEINTALAQAANKLSKAKALVKKLSAVETLGATTIICTDKTGTLTKNQMTVEQFVIGTNVYTVTGTGYDAASGFIKDARHKPLNPETLHDLSLFFETGVYASNAEVSPPDAEHGAWYCIGDPTEGALITLARKAGIDIEHIRSVTSEIKELPFDSARKRMSSIRSYGPDGEIYVFVKGSPESMLARSTHIWENGSAKPLTIHDKKHISQLNDRWAKAAMRNLAFGFRVLPPGTNIKKLTINDVEKNITFMGMVSMMDPLRDEVVAAMTDAHSAHIKVSIITGDYAKTAAAIAQKAGLAQPHNSIKVITGDEIRTLDDSHLLHLATRGGIIFSRVSPEDKLRIVELVKSSNQVVAVTGDGINDAPALKRADIGVAMGKSGTDVAKQSAEIILMDDSFHTLINAVQQGRTIFQNIKKGTLSCFTSNSAELIVNTTSLAALVAFKIPLALNIMQILAIDMIAELFPIAALGWDKADGNVMNDKPRNLHEHILNPASIIDLLWCGLLIGGLAFCNYLLFFNRNGVSLLDAREYANTGLYLKATTITYVTIVLCQLANIMQRRSNKGLFTRYQLHNRLLWLSLAFSLACVSVIIYNPVVAPYFGAAPLSAVDWLYAAGATALFVVAREVQRYANNNHSRDIVLNMLNTVNQ